MKLDGLDDWITIKALWRLAEDAEASQLKHTPARDNADARMRPPLRHCMRHLINRPSASTIARDLSIALIIAGAVILLSF